MLAPLFGGLAIHVEQNWRAARRKDSLTFHPSPKDTGGDPLARDEVTINGKHLGTSALVGYMSDALAAGVAPEEPLFRDLTEHALRYGIDFDHNGPNSFYSAKRRKIMGAKGFFDEHKRRILDIVDDADIRKDTPEPGRLSMINVLG